MNKKLIRGFTLNELLVVIAIIGILASVVAVSLTRTKQKSVDAKRISTLKDLEQAVELYFQEKHEFPESITTLVQAGYYNDTDKAVLIGAPDDDGVDFVYAYKRSSDKTHYCLGVRTKIIENSTNCNYGDLDNLQPPYTASYYKYRFQGP